MSSTRDFIVRQGFFPITRHGVGREGNDGISLVTILNNRLEAGWFP
ncbi:MAG: hypothetical protein GY727_14865 [Gammaproteobacteria bacterium]|nr:hypothetical protein [Gammaproteobacteria bacterium]